VKVLTWYWQYYDVVILTIFLMKLLENLRKI